MFARLPFGLDKGHSTAASVQLIDVPVFQKLERVKGDWDGISRQILELSATGSQAWLEVIYEDDEVIGDLRERLENRYHRYSNGNPSGEEQPHYRPRTGANP